MVLKELKGFGLRRVYIAGTSLPIPCASKYRGANLGADRLVNAYAAWRLLRKGCVVADSGTALTLDAVSPRGVYQGGVIAPGIGIAMVSLNHGTAQLPRLRPSLAPVLIGTDTDSSIRSGVVRGTAAMVESMTLQMCALMRCPPALVMTGADAALLARYLRIAYQVVPDLTLRGLYQAYCALRNAKEEYYAVT
jgi:type III pantothenate kinase